MSVDFSKMSDGGVAFALEQENFPYDVRADAIKEAILRLRKHHAERMAKEADDVVTRLGGYASNPETGKMEPFYHTYRRGDARWNNDGATQ